MNIKTFMQHPGVYVEFHIDLPTQNLGPSGEGLLAQENEVAYEARDYFILGRAI